ncbi:MAG: urea carboxylase [Fibrobacteria bacterium]|nr:urea carboxylase [Fibrobacteria bacterium]
MFHTVLVANRGEIALRAIRTLRRLGVRSVAIHSDPDRHAPHVAEADLAVSLGGVKPSENYLDIESILRACLETGAQAVYPGYGFLSESAEFAEACEAAGILFVGPTPHQIREFGLKHRAREIATASAVPLAPGTGLLSSVEEALAEADRIGWPVMLKTTAGGGGIGLSRCDDAAALRSAFDSVSRLGAQFFRDGGVFLERFVDQARHVEVQILGDGKGNVWALGERDCSLQRRNQKVLEETPAPNLPVPTRKALHEAAVRLGRSISYRSAGTVEFLYDARRDEFHFLEVNTRLQVEHPVTEMVTGLDLVECMLRVACGDPLPVEDLERAPRGASIEVRLYAEDPVRNFQPSPGVLTEVSFPDSARVDGWISTGTEVSAHYDPMLAKLIVHGKDRAEAIRLMSEALGKTRLQGIQTNLAWLRSVIQAPEFVAGTPTTRLLDSFTWSPDLIEVLDPGTSTTIQDHPGRVGHWDVGVPPSGPMDDWSFRLANRLVGNPPDAAGFEATLQGPSLRFHRGGVIALAGARVDATLDDIPVPMNQAIRVEPGQVLKTGRARSGCRIYLAVRGGLDVPLYLGSRSTFTLGQFGGHGGRILRVGDMIAPLAFGSDASEPRFSPLAEDFVPEFPTTWRIGALVGPHAAPDYLTTESVEEFFAEEWEVHYNSNRLGVRLVGPKPRWTRRDGGEAGLHPSNVHDCEYAVGSINFTGDSPVILTVDGPSLGGFVCPATIAKAELWKVGQVKPGDRIRFVPIDLERALELELDQLTRLSTLEGCVPDPQTLRPVAWNGALLVDRAARDHHPRLEIRQAGDTYLLLEYGEDVLDLALRLRVHLLMQSIRSAGLPVEELAPGVRSLQIRYHDSRITRSDLLERLLDLDDALPDVAEVSIPTRVLHLPMAFEDSATLGAVQRYRETVRAEAPWLPSNTEFLRRINGLTSVEEVAQTIFATSYMVLGLGDVYLGAPCAVPVDPRHRLLSSKYNPARTFTAEGTVGIGGMYMCIYGMDSPGGYQLVGRTLPIWNKFLRNRSFDEEPWLLKFFDQVRFHPVSEEELEIQRDLFREGKFQVRTEEETFHFGEYTRFLEREADSIAAFRERQKSAYEDEVRHWANSPAAISSPSLPPGETVVPEGDPVRSDMHGSVWKILVEPGSIVKAGDPLVVIEAMKMEMQVVAPRDGMVSAVLAKTGSPVATGDLLAVLAS